MRDFMLRPEINDNMVMYLSLHSAGQYLLIPTGLDANKIPEYDDYASFKNFIKIYIRIILLKSF